MTDNSPEIRVFERDIHTVLLPLDLALSSMEVPFDVLEPDCFAFDTVVLIEGVVPAVGFHVKFLQKMVAGHAKVVFSGSNAFDSTFDAAVDALEEVTQAGAQRIIMVSETGHLPPEHKRLRGLIHDLGLELHEWSWRRLLNW